MALELFSSVRYLLRPEEISIDNWVFRLHYRLTVLFLVGSSFIGVAKQYFGDPINCQTASGVSSKVMDDYCWIHSTFHVRSEFQGNVGCILDRELLVTHHSASVAHAHRMDVDERIAHLVAADTPDTAFYQWVPFTLIFQALVFYIPRKLWKSFEGGLMESFGKDAKKSIIVDDGWDAGGGGGNGGGGGVFLLPHHSSHHHHSSRHGGGGNGGNNAAAAASSSAAAFDCSSVLRREAVARKYSRFFRSTLHHNNGYFLQYFSCEVLNFAIDLANIYFTDVFLGGRFIKYGVRVLRFYSHSHAVRRDMPNPMCTAFPTVTSCTFHSVGTAAGEQKFNSLCVLSLNIINEKIYLFLWFWFYSLTLITGCHLVFRIFVLIMPCSRSFLLLLRARLFRPSDLRTVRRILSRCYLGDWWVLYQIGRNSNTHFFRFFLSYLDACLNKDVASAAGSLGRSAGGSTAGDRRRRRRRPRHHRPGGGGHPGGRGGDGTAAAEKAEEDEDEEAQENEDSLAEEDDDYEYEEEDEASTTAPVGMPRPHSSSLQSSSNGGVRRRPYQQQQQHRAPLNLPPPSYGASRQQEDDDDKKRIGMPYLTVA